MGEGLQLVWSDQLPTTSIVVAVTQALPLGTNAFELLESTMMPQLTWMFELPLVVRAPWLPSPAHKRSLDRPRYERQPWS